MIDDTLLRSARPAEEGPSGEVVARHRAQLIDAFQPPTVDDEHIEIPPPDATYPAAAPHPRKRRPILVLAAMAALVVAGLALVRDTTTGPAPNGVAGSGMAVDTRWYLPAAMPEGWSIAYASDRGELRSVVFTDDQGTATAEIWISSTSFATEALAVDLDQLDRDGGWTQLRDSTLARTIDDVIVQFHGPTEPFTGVGDRRPEITQVPESSLPVAVIDLAVGPTTAIDTVVWNETAYTLHVAGPSGSHVGMSIIGPPADGTGATMPMLSCCTSLDLDGRSLRYADFVVGEPGDGVLAAFLLRPDVDRFDIHFVDGRTTEGRPASTGADDPVNFALVNVPDRSPNFNERIDLGQVDRIVTYDIAGAEIETVRAPFLS